MQEHAKCAFVIVMGVFRVKLLMNGCAGRRKSNEQNQAAHQSCQNGPGRAYPVLLLSLQSGDRLSRAPTLRQEQC